MLVIGYSGTLAFSDSKKTRRPSLIQKLKSFFWTYRHNYHLSGTRSAVGILAAIQGLQKRFPGESLQVKLVLWGNIDKRYIELSQQMGIGQYVEVLDFMPKDKSILKLHQCDLVYLPIETGAENHKTLFIPGKVFEYLSLKKPILFDDTESDCAAIIKKSGLGILTDRGNIDQLSTIIYELSIDKSIIKAMKPNIPFIESLSFHHRAKEIAQVFDSLTND